MTSSEAWTGACKKGGLIFRLQRIHGSPCKFEWPEEHFMTMTSHFITTDEIFVSSDTAGIDSLTALSLRRIGCIDNKL